MFNCSPWLVRNCWKHHLIGWRACFGLLFSNDAGFWGYFKVIEWNYWISTCICHVFGVCNFIHIVSYLRNHYRETNHQWIAKDRCVMNDWSRPYSQSGSSSNCKGSPTCMMWQLGWNTLEECRNQARAVMMYRIVHGLIAILASLYLTSNIHDTREHRVKFCISAWCVEVFKYSFFPATTWIWNQLPSDVMSQCPCPSRHFKSRLADRMATQMSI